MSERWSGAIPAYVLTLDSVISGAADRVRMGTCVSDPALSLVCAARQVTSRNINHLSPYVPASQPAARTMAASTKDKAITSMKRDSDGVVFEVRNGVGDAKFSCVFVRIISSSASHHPLTTCGDHINRTGG